MEKGKAEEHLRYYQTEALSSIFSELETNRSTLLVLATGLGKTETFATVAAKWPGRVLVLAHREELVDQAYKRLKHLTGETIEIEQASLHSAKARIVVGSVQTVYREERLDALAKKGGFSLVIVDEAHHYVSPTYRKPLDYFTGAKVLGVTATPDRADAKAMGQIFDSVAYSMDLRDGIEAGYLVPIRGREVELTEVNLDLVGVNNGDLAAGELDEEVLKGCEGVVKGMIEHSGDRQGVVFFPGVHSSKVAASRFNAIKEHSARSVDGETPKDERRQLMEDFRNGKFQFLCNCMVATEGFDAPTASVIGLARPTKSRSLYAQMVGRGTRVLPGTVDAYPGEHGAALRRGKIELSGKPACLLLDFVGNNTRHALVTPEDLLGGRYDDEERKLSKRLRKEAEPGKELDVQDSLAQARGELQRQRMAAAARSVRSSVRALSRDFDPFRMLGVDRDRESQFAMEYGYKPMSAPQRKFLEKQGFAPKVLDETSARAASRLIGNIIKRKQEGLMSHRQAAMLVRFGVKNTDLTQQAASAAIDYVKKTKNHDPLVLRELVSNEEF